PGLPRGLMPALIATGVLHIWLLVMCQSIFLQPEPHRLDSVIDSRLVEAMQPEKIEQVFEYQLAKPVEDRDIPLQPIVNAMSVGQSETRQPKPESLHEPSDILDPTRSRDRLTDIPEGVEVDERVVVKGNT